MRIAGALFGLVGLLLAGGMARLALIEVRDGESLRRLAAKQQTTRVYYPGLRGEILDTRGRLLAGTIRRPSVFADPAMVPSPRYAACSIAPVLGMDPGKLEEAVVNTTQPRFTWLKRGVTAAEAEAFEAVVQDRGLGGLGLQYEPVRVYPQGRLAPHVLGFVGVDLKPAQGELPAHEDLRGLAGLEELYNDLLSGTAGWQASIVDVVRRRVRSEEYQPAADGATIVLTVDAYIQQVAQDKLREAVDKYEAEWGAAVVMDPQSGEVLAMASIPDFDPNDPFPGGFGEMSAADRKVAERVWRNRAIADAYEPGSVFKPFVASCALDEGVVQIDEVFPINGPVHVFGRRTIHDTHPYGALAVHEIVSKSSNIGMGMIGARCGMARLHRYVRSFGFGDVTGLGLPGEHSGLVQDFSRWNVSFSPQSIPIGQEVAITPIQVATAFSVFCNGGVLMRPRIVRGLIGPDGETLADYSAPVAIRRVLSEEMTATFRRRALVETVNSGTGKLAKLDDYQVFGKTGTAQIASVRGRGYSSGQYVASFVAGAPSDVPRVVVLVSIYRPTKGGYYGGVVSAPVVKEIIAETLAYMQVPPEIRAPEEPAGAAGKKPGRPDARERKRDDDTDGF